MADGTKKKTGCAKRAETHGLGWCIIIGAGHNGHHGFDIRHGVTAMVAEFFHGAQVRWGDCIKRQPWAFMRGFVAGSIILVGAIGMAIGWEQTYTEEFKPTLRLVEDTVMVGGHLGFYQGVIPPQRCPQETVRMIWRQKTPTEREIYPLPDFNIVPSIWEGKSVVFLRLPDDIVPGPWFYRRETAQWCSWWNFFTRPMLTRTNDVPFTVVARGFPKG